MEPYVPTAQATVVDEEKKKKKKKKKQTSSDPYVPEAEMVEVKVGSKKPKSNRKPKSEKKPKSERKPGKKSKKKSSTSGSEYVQAAAVQVESYPVLEASGWEPLLIDKINAEHTKGSALHKYAITGHESQIVTISIPPGETCQGEPGSMMYLSDPIDMNVSCGSDWFGRCCGGESCCVLNFTNSQNQTGYAGLVTNSPLAKVVPIEMGSPAVGGHLIVQSGAYMASFGEVHLTYDCDCNLARCCCGGMVRADIEIGKDQVGWLVFL